MFFPSSAHEVASQGVVSGPLVVAASILAVLFVVAVVASIVLVLRGQMRRAGVTALAAVVAGVVGFVVFWIAGLSGD